MQQNPILKRGFLAQKDAGSKEPLKGLLITFEIGRSCSLGNIMRPESRKKLRELVPTDSQLQAKQVWPALIKVINILKPIIKQEAVNGSLPFTSRSCRTPQPNNQPIVSHGDRSCRPGDSHWMSPPSPSQLGSQFQAISQNPCWTQRWLVGYLGGGRCG